MSLANTQATVSSVNLHITVQPFYFINMLVLFSRVFLTTKKQFQAKMMVNSVEKGAFLVNFINYTASRLCCMLPEHLGAVYCCHRPEDESKEIVLDDKNWNKCSRIRVAVWNILVSCEFISRQKSKESCSAQYIASLQFHISFPRQLLLEKINLYSVHKAKELKKWLKIKCLNQTFSAVCHHQKLLSAYSLASAEHIVV